MPLLETMDGFLSIERFESLARPGKLLSLAACSFMNCVWTPANCYRARQRNSGAYGCDLLVNGQQLNTGAWGPYRDELAATASGSAVAVWDEEDPVTRFFSRIRYTTKASTSSNWVVPSALPGEPLGESASIEIVARGPGGTLALVWTPLQDCSTTSCNIYEYRVSKYVNGAWTTQSLAIGNSLRKIAINASGSGVLTSEDTDCNTNGSCTRGLSLYRF